MGFPIRTTSRTITLLILPRTRLSVRGYHTFHHLLHLKLHHPHCGVGCSVIDEQLLPILHQPRWEDDVGHESIDLEVGLGCEEWARRSTQDFRWVEGIEKDRSAVIRSHIARFGRPLVPVIDRQEAFGDADR